MGSPNEAAAEPGTGSATVDVSHTTTTATGAATTTASAAVNISSGTNNSTDSVSHVESSSSHGSSSNSNNSQNNNRGGTWDDNVSAGVASLKTIHAQANGEASGRISCTTPQPQQPPVQQLPSGQPTQAVRPATPPPEGVNPPAERNESAPQESTERADVEVDVVDEVTAVPASCSASSSVSSGSGDHYCLRWTNHGSHVLSVFSQLLRDEALVDVTLAAEGQSLRAHKMVLSACSSFFRTLFVSHPERHPIIILKDTKFEELKTLLEYMYKGEVSVEYGQLGTLLKTAENLRVKGLAEVTTNHASATAPPAHGPPAAADEAVDEDDSDAMDEDDHTSPIVLERERLPAVVESEPCLSHRPRSGRSLYPLSRGYGNRSIYQHKSSYRSGGGSYPSVDSARPYSQNHRTHGGEHARSSAATKPDAYSKRHHHRHNHLTHQTNAQHPPEEKGTETVTDPAADPADPAHSKSDSALVVSNSNGTDLSRRKSPSTLDHSSPQRQPAEQCNSEAEDLRRVTAESPSLSESSAYRNPHGASSARPPAASNNIGHFWHGTPMDEESESSESDDCDEFAQSPSEHGALLRRSPMAGRVTAAGHEPSLIGRQPPSHFHSAASGGSGSARLDPPQHFPLPLKKETEWESVSLNMAPGTSRSDAQASRSPSFSESSSEYGRHADQEQEEPGPADDPIPRPLSFKQEAQEAPDEGKSSGHEGDSAADGRHAGQPTETVSPSDLIDNPDVNEGLSLGDPPIVENLVSSCPSPASCTCLCCGLVLSSPSRLARHMLAHNLVQGSAADTELAPQRGHKRRHLSALHLGSQSSSTSSLASSNRPPSSAPIFSCLNLIAGSHLEELNRSRQMPGPCFSFGSSPASSTSSRSRHHSSDMMALAEDLRSRPSSRSQGPLSLMFPETGAGTTTAGSSSILRALGPSPLGEMPSRVASPSAGSMSGSLGVRERAMAMLGVASSSAVLDGSFGSLAPGVAVLASLMGGSTGDSHLATDLSLGSVMFPSVRLAPGASQTGHHQHSIGGDTQAPVANIGHVASGSAAPPFANLSLQSYSAAAAALALTTPIVSMCSSTHSTPSSSAPSVVPSSSCSSSSSSNNNGGHQSAPVASSCATASSSAGSSVGPSNLRSHAALAGSGPPALCKFCGKSFVELGALMAHLPFHTGERPFRCDFCGKAFKLRHHMKDHARVHTGERPFPCRLCGKTFSRSTILKAHEKTHLPKSERGAHFGLPGQPPVSPAS